MTITLELPEKLHQQALNLAITRGATLNTWLMGLIEGSVANVEDRYPNGLASLAEEDPEFAHELAAWDALSDEAFYLLEQSEE